MKNNFCTENHGRNLALLHKYSSGRIPHLHRAFIIMSRNNKRYTYIFFPVQNDFIARHDELQINQIGPILHKCPPHFKILYAQLIVFWTRMESTPRFFNRWRKLQGKCFEKKKSMNTIIIVIARKIARRLRTPFQKKKKNILMENLTV